MHTQNDTICALASATGKGGVSVIRVSGAKARAYCQSLTDLTPEPRIALFSKFQTSTAELIDTGLTLFFKGPHSFTGEDVCEFHCHGSPVVVDQILTQLVNLGARLARPGEFSERAFLNNKIDLAQAEAIADLIDSSTVQAARHAVRSLQGDFSKLVYELVRQVIELRVYVEASIDFADEDIDFLSRGNILARLQTLVTTINTTLTQAQTGSLLREGLRVVIVGAPNVGKSTLLNALCGHEVAIVTPIAGTTRDMLQQIINIDGIAVHVTDTAGLRQSDDPIEAEGILRARKALAEADHVLLLFDANDRDVFRTLPVWQELSGLPLHRLTLVFNKIDLCHLKSAVYLDSVPQQLFLSAATRDGLELLKEYLKTCAGLVPGSDGGFMARRRHLAALTTARDSLMKAVHCLEYLNAGELVAEELRTAQQHLDEITGKFTTDDLLGAIFSSFCVGK